MRLHRLSMTAFGPFAGTEVVDFDALSASGLFLLHGPTGAGKTSVLDAVSYAIYGQVPGARADGRPRLRSDHAPADREPRVQLELTVAGRRLEVTRTPEWVRPKKRGVGVTTAPAATHVRELVEGDWAPLTTRNDEAAQLLLDLVGMGHEQFTKVVLLPQGDFAAFLRADAEERRLLLGRLFAIDRFTAVEGWLADERRRLAAQVVAADQQVAGLLARAAEAFAGLPDTDEGEVNDDDGAVAGQVEVKAARRVADLLERAETLARGAQVELEEQTERASAARVVLAEATALTDRRTRWAQATSRLAALDEAADSHAEAVRRIALARRAAPLTGLLEALDSSRSKAQLAAGAARRARDAVPLPARAADELGLRRLISGYRTQLGSLEAALARLDELGSLSSRIATLTAQRAEAVSAGAAAVLDHRRASIELERARTAEQQAALQAADLDPATAAETAAARVVELVVKLTRSDQAVVDAERAVSRAVDHDQRTREYQLELWQRRVANIAGELAAGLRDGEPCQVCGSPEHPLAAPMGAEQVGRAEVDAAAAEADTTRTAREHAERTLSSLLAGRSELRALTLGLDEDAARRALDLTRSRVHSAKAAGDTHAREAAAATAARDQQERAVAAQQRWASEREGSAATLVQLSQAFDALSGELDRLRGDDADVLARSTRLAAESVAMESLLDLLVTARGAAQSVAEQQVRFAATCTGCGFADVTEGSAAVLAPATLDRLAVVVDEHDRRRGDSLAILAAPDLAGVGELPDPAVASAQGQVDQVDRALRRAASRSTLTQEAVRRLGRLAREVAEYEDATAPARQQHDLVDQLAGCVHGTGGDNALRMRLSAFVLAARLEEVAAAATERLAVMSDGRYALVHSDERAKGGGRSGLGLRVVDAWTGVERDTATLSGGESFLASLALALGLADVVQAEAGGARIETLFVDEGFGTLDEETLEEVMTVLDGLRDGGRAVGLVSHVRELQARIPAQLEVRKTRSGSTLVQRTPEERPAGVR